MIGIESEFPVVDQFGEAAGPEAIESLFGWLSQRHGFEPYRDGHTGALIGVRRAQEQGRLDVGTDYGVCTLEVAFPPEEGFSAAEAGWNGFVDGILLPALATQRLSILGYGCQPKTDASGPAFVAPKGHYQRWLDLVGHHDVHIATDAFPSFAALQFNLDLPLAKVVQATNTFIKLSPLICAWSANSPVFGGRAQPWLETRAKGYLALADVSSFFTGRLFFPRRCFVNLADYLMEAWKLPLFEVKRGDKVLFPTSLELTTLDFARAGNAEFVDLDGAKANLSCETGDLGLALAFTWPAVRIKTQLDEGLGVREILDAVAAGRAETVLLDGGRATYIELRHLPTMDRTETFAWLALFLGWLADIDACSVLVEDWSMDQVRASFDQVLVQGWAATIGGRGLQEWGAQAFDAAHTALARHHEPLQERLAPLRRRIAAGSSPARDVLATFATGGIDALVHQLTLA